MPSTIPQRLLTLWQSVSIRAVSVGYKTVHIYSPREIEQAQLGYSIDSNGISLTGTADGDWKQNWIVIGYEDETGDPLFTDINDEAFPIYTAIHGTGAWEPELISVSFNNFIKALEKVGNLSIGRQTPVELENNPISKADLDDLIINLKDENPGASTVFWELWLSPSQ